MSTVPAASSIVHSNPPRFTCTAGLRRHEFGVLTLWLRSPKTGRQLEITEQCLTVNRVRHLLGRVAKARSEGKTTADFTSEELKTLVELHERTHSVMPFTITAKTRSSTRF